MKFLIHTLDEFGKTQMGGLYMYMPEIINLFFFTFFMFLPFQENGPYFSEKLRFGQVQMLSTNCLRLLVHLEILKRKRKANKTLK